MGWSQYARETVHREFQEEIRQRLAGVRMLGVPENIMDLIAHGRP